MGRDELLNTSVDAIGEAFKVSKGYGNGIRNIVIDGNLGGGTITLEGGINSDLKIKWITLGTFTENEIVALEPIATDLWLRASLSGSTNAENARVTLLLLS